MPDSERLAPEDCRRGDGGRDELSGQEDPPLQRHHGPLHARLVGAVPIQYPWTASRSEFSFWPFSL